MELKKELHIAIKAALSAGDAVMKIYKEDDFQIEAKDDASPLTIADKKANDIINSYLIPTGIPIISEENKQLSFEDRKEWDFCWIVDPVDGTKEFIKRNGEFTINIALIRNGKPELGVIFAPALEILYFGIVEEGKAFKTEISTVEKQNISEVISLAKEIKPCTAEERIKIVGSRSHMNEETLEYISSLETKTAKKTEIVSKGSSLKFCLVAEGTAHIYPRFAPTMEWDTAAGQAICEAVGLKVAVRETGEALCYNRENLINPYFLISGEGQIL